MKIKIKDYDYEIIEVDDKNDRDLFDKKGNEENFGRHFNLTCQIKILKNISYIQKRKTLIHELTHAFVFVYLTNQGLENKFNEEDICCIMATYSEDILKIVNDYFKSN